MPDAGQPAPAEPVAVVRDVYKTCIYHHPSLQQLGCAERSAAVSRLAGRASPCPCVAPRGRSTDSANHNITTPTLQTSTRWIRRQTSCRTPRAAQEAKRAAGDRVSAKRGKGRAGAATGTTTHQTDKSDEEKPRVGAGHAARRRETGVVVEHGVLLVRVVQAHIGLVGRRQRGFLRRQRDGAALVKHLHGHRVRRCGVVDVEGLDHLRRPVARRLPGRRPVARAPAIGGRRHG